jgi:hypothetical protein
MKLKVEGVPDTKKESGKRNIARIVAESSLLPGKGTIFSCFLFSNSGVRKTERLNICYTHRNSISRTQDNFSNISIHNLNFHSSRTY